MADWLEFNSKDIPSDIMAGGYERIRKGYYAEPPLPRIIDYITFSDMMFAGLRLFIYRPVKIPEPTHDERCSLWFRQTEAWVRVQKYDPSVPTKKCYQLSNGNNVSKEWFKGKLSREIPLEENK